MQFEWDSSKDAINVQKHGVSFREATQVFKDPNAFDLEDAEHSEIEPRQFITGRILDGRIITVRFTIRDDVIRIFGAGEWRTFRRIYYEKTRHKAS